LLKEKTFGIDFARLAEYFNSADCAVACGEGCWQLLDCVVTVTPLPDEHLSRTVSFPRTKVCVTGCENDVDRVFYDLILRFLSAGG
jgi:hypothetical protein